MRLGKYLSSLTKPELDNLYEICGLTEEEVEICEMIRARKTYSEISYKLGYGCKTVYNRVLMARIKIEKYEERRCYIMAKPEVEVKDKINLTVTEAAAYSNIGENKIRELIEDPNCDFVLNVGRKILIKRLKFEAYLSKVNVL